MTTCWVLFFGLAVSFRCASSVMVNMMLLLQHNSKQLFGRAGKAGGRLPALFAYLLLGFRMMYLF